MRAGRPITGLRSGEEAECGGSLARCGAVRLSGRWGAAEHERHCRRRPSCAWDALPPARKLPVGARDDAHVNIKRNKHEK